MAKKRSRADRLLRSMDRTERRTEARPEEPTATPKQDVNQPAKPVVKKAS